MKKLLKLPHRICESTCYVNGLEDILNTLGNEYKAKQWIEASSLFRTSGEKIKKLCEAALKQDKPQISKTLLEIADTEEHAYKLLKDV